MTVEKKGVRFWLESIINIPGMPARKSSNPWEGIPGEVTLYNLPGVPGGKLTVRGEVFVENPTVARAIAQRPSCGMRYNPQELVNAGAMTVEEVRAMGYSVEPPKQPVVLVKDEVKMDGGIPDLDTMTKAEILEYASGAGITVSGERSKPFVVNQIREWFKRKRIESS